MTDPRVAERYDEKLAAAFLGMNDKLTGLPEFLGVHLTRFEPGRLTAEMLVHDRLLTPFGNMHGGVISAVCDHVLGVVCYPHMPKGSWAATTEFKVNLLAQAREDGEDRFGIVGRGDLAERLLPHHVRECAFGRERKNR